MPSIAKYPGTGTSENVGLGTIAWTSPGSITASDNVDASIALTTTNFLSEYLFATNFNFGIPGLASIDGFIVTYERFCDTIRSVQDSKMYLVLDGNLDGVWKNGAYWNVTSSFDTFGSPTDKWGLAGLTPDEVNASNFGVALECQFGDVYATTVFGNVDSVEMIVYYTLYGIKYATTSITNVYYGTTEIQKIYHESTQIG